MKCIGIASCTKVLFMSKCNDSRGRDDEHEHTTTAQRPSQILLIDAAVLGGATVLCCSGQCLSPSGSDARSQYRRLPSSEQQKILKHSAGGSHPKGTIPRYLREGNNHRQRMELAGKIQNMICDDSRERLCVITILGHTAG